MRPPHIDWTRRILCVILSGPAAALATATILAISQPETFDEPTTEFTHHDSATTSAHR